MRTLGEVEALDNSLKGIVRRHKEQGHEFSEVLEDITRQVGYDRDIVQRARELWNE